MTIAVSKSISFTDGGSDPAPGASSNWDHADDRTGDTVYEELVKLTSILSRRFNAAGVAQGSPFLVNTTTTGNQSDPAVSMDADGNFVVVWTSSDQDGSGDVTRSRSTASSAMSMEIAR